MHIVLDFRNKIPLTEQIRLEMRKRILAKDLPPGTPLPTVRSLAQELRVNFNTVSRAYRALDAEGLITTRQGRGTIVNDWETVQTESALGKPKAADGTKKSQRQKVAELVESLFHKAKEVGISDRQLRQAFRMAGSYSVSGCKGMGRRLLLRRKTTAERGHFAPNQKRMKKRSRYIRKEYRRKKQ